MYVVNVSFIYQTWNGFDYAWKMHDNLYKYMNKHDKATKCTCIYNIKHTHIHIFIYYYRCTGTFNVHTYKFHLLSATTTAKR